MKRAEYEAQLANQHEPLETRYMKETSRLDALLADLKVKVNLYQDGSIYRYRLLDENEETIIEGLTPAFANHEDYRRVILRIREGQHA